MDRRAAHEVVSCSENRLSQKRGRGAHNARHEEGAYPHRYSIELVGRSPAKTTEQHRGMGYIACRMSTGLQDRTLQCV